MTPALGRCRIGAGFAMLVQGVGGSGVWKSFMSPLSPPCIPPSASVCRSFTPPGYKHCHSLGTEHGSESESAAATLTQRSANAQLLINSRD